MTYWLLTCALALAGGEEAPRDAHDEEARAEASTPIVVTGTRTPRTIREAPVRTDVVGPGVLTRAAPRNLADAIEFLAGARAESNCQNCNTTEIQLLGLPGAYNQILLDGLPLVSGVAAVYGIEQIPAVLVESIEVVKGGASVLYGPGALAGVVNVLPLRPTRDGLRASVDYERIHGETAVFGSLLGSHVFQSGFANLFAQAEHSPAIDLNGDAYSELARRKLATAGGHVEWRPSKATTLAIDYQYTSERRRGGNMLDRPAHLANITEAIGSDIHRASLHVSTDLGGGTRLLGTYALSSLRRRSFYGGLGNVQADPAAPDFDPAAFAAAAAISRNQYGRTRNMLHYAEARLETAVGGHALLAGFQYRTESVADFSVDADGRLLGTLVDDRFDTRGAFVQDEWTLGTGLRLVLGGRVDKSSELDDLVFSPRIGLWASPNSSLVLRANYSTGFRAPDVFSEDIHVDVLGAAPIRIRNAPGLLAERADSVSLGFDWRPTWRNGAFTLDGQAYITRIRDTFVLGEIERAGDGALFRTRTNASGSRVAGGEINLGYRFSGSLNATIGMAYIDARYDDPQPVFHNGATVLTTRRFLKTPRLSGVGQLVWRVFPSCDVFTAGRYTGPMDVLNNRLGAIRRSGSYLVVDLTATRHFPIGDGTREVDLTFGVKNVTDARQRDLETGANRDSDFVYGPRLPRTMFARINARF